MTIPANVIPVLAALAHAGGLDMDDQRAVATAAALRYDHVVGYWIRGAEPDEYRAALEEARRSA